MESSRSNVKPLLKWVGGKRQLLPQLRRFYPAAFNAYIEPFLGSGAVFFDLYRSGVLVDRDVVLIDSNADLIGCYHMVRDSVDGVADALESLADAHSREGQAHYYRVRDETFNPQREARRLPDGQIAYTPELAAMLIYLNRTGFNGLFRVNAHGAYNVPAGRYERPRIADRSRLLEVSAALAGPRVRLEWGIVHTRDGAGTRRGLFVHRSAVRAAQSHVELHQLHRVTFRQPGAGGVADDGAGTGRARVSCLAEQLNGRRDLRVVRPERARQKCRASSVSRASAARHQQQGVAAWCRRRVFDYQHRPGERKTRTSAHQRAVQIVIARPLGRVLRCGVLGGEAVS